MIYVDSYPNTKRFVSKRKLDFVSADVPILLRLDVLDRKSFLANNKENELLEPLAGWSMPLERKFFRGAKEVRHTEPELVKLHRQLRHSQMVNSMQ